MTRVRRLALAAVLLAVLVAALAAATPALLKWQAQTRGTELLGRPVAVGAVSLKPWAMELTVDELMVGAAEGAASAPLLQVGRARANLALWPLLQGVVHVESLEIQAPALRLTRLDAEHWDIDDLIARLRPQNPTQGEPLRLAVHDLQITDGRLRWDDRTAGRVHELTGLRMSLPFASTEASQAQTEIAPRLAFRLNGADVETQATGTPLAATPRGTLSLRVGGLDLAPYLPYLPASLPLRPTAGRLTLDLHTEATRPAEGPLQWQLKGLARADDLTLQDTRGATPVAWRSLQVELQDLQPLARQVTLGKVRLEGAQLQLGRDASGRWLLPGTGGGSAPVDAARKDEPAPAWQARIGQVELADAQLQWRDASLKPAASWQLEAIEGQASELQWPNPAPVDFAVSARLRSAGQAGTDKAVARLQAEGKASDRQARVSLQLQDLALRTLAPYLDTALAARVDGRLGLQGTLDWQAGPKDERLQVALARVRLDAPSMAPPASPRTKTPASAQRLELQDAQIDAMQRRVTLGALRLTQPSLALARQADGSLDVARWLKPPAADRQAPPPARRKEAPWRLAVKKLDLNRGRLQWRDDAVMAGPDEPLQLDVRGIQLAVQDLAWAGEAAVPPARVTMRAQLGEPLAAGQKAPDTGGIAWQGRVGLQPLQADGELRLQRLPLALLGPYVEPQLPVHIPRAEAGYTGRVSFAQKEGGPLISLQGDALLGDVHVTTRRGPIHEALRATGEEELLSWQALALKGLDFSMGPQQRPRLSLDEVAATDLYARLRVTEAGRLNLQGLATGDDASPADSAPASSVPDTSPAPSPPVAPSAWPLDLVVESTRLNNGRIDFNDRYIRPNYSAQLTELQGEMGTFRSDSPELAALQLRGRVAGTGLLEIAGRLNPATRPPQLDLRARASDIELPPLSPYAGKYAGYAIERGKLSVNVAYRIEPDGRLQASNQVVLNQLTFGERIESPSATKLPVLLAVSLLKDRHGVIDVDLPISGSLNDPQFSLGGVIVKVIVNLLAKAITAPFSLLFGGGGQELSEVAFQPGTARVMEASAPAIDKVAQALLDRPALHLTLTGSADPVIEREAFQRETVEARLLAERRRELLRQGAAAEAPATLTPADRSRLLKTLYTATELPDKPKNVIGLARSLPDAEMEALLRKHVPVNDEGLRALALQRAMTLRDALVARGLPGERLFLASPKLHGPPDSAEGWVPHVQLSLSMR